MAKRIQLTCAQLHKQIERGDMVLQFASAVEEFLELKTAGMEAIFVENGNVCELCSFNLVSTVKVNLNDFF